MTKKLPPAKKQKTAARPKKIRRKKGRLIAILCILFLLAFFLSGGSKIFSPRTWQSIGEFLPPLPPLAAANTLHETETPDLTSRLARIIFVRRAVAQRIDTDRSVPLAAIPLPLQQAIIAVEDRRYRDHCGIDPEGIARASLVNLQAGEIEEGASTITQQVVKNLFLSNEQTFGRKAEEILIALSLEMNYNKEEILELYLNTIYYGSNFYGIEDAARGYFGKSPSELNLAEASMLAGLPNAPSIYSPYVDFIMAKKRQIIVLDAMIRAGYITEKEAENAKIYPIELKD